MTLHPIDWLVLTVPMLVICSIAWRTRRHVKGVVDFLAAGRCAGRYLVCISVGEASMGAISVVALFEMTYKAGFTMTWWQTLTTPVPLLVALTGFVCYRYRETRALTLAQFMEMRYSRRFRVFMGVLAFAAGVINYGIFPAVGARFFVYYCGFPQQITVAGASVPTFALVMLLTVGSSLVFVLLGGQLTAMVADCLEGIISNVMYLLVIGALLYMFSWTQVSQTLITQAPPGQSLLNPLDTADANDFNVWFVLIGAFAMVYSAMAWQGSQGFNSSASTPHEAKMGKILGVWRNLARLVMIGVPAICAYTFLHNPSYADLAEPVKQTLSAIENSKIREQMTVPVALSHLLPIGFKGMFASIVLFALIATDSASMHSWGSIFIQDCVLPFRKVPLSPSQHIRLLRWSITGVAIFAFLFSFLFRQTDYILMFFAVTGAIFLGGAGSVIIGGLYWKRGTTAGAWVGMIVGSSLAVSGIVLKQILPEVAPNGQYMYGLAMVSAIVAYLFVSLLSYRQPFNLDRMLHRGRYSIAEDGTPLPSVAKPPRTLAGLLGIDAQFSFGDKLQSILLFSWTIFWFALVLIFTMWNLLSPWPMHWWAKYWQIAGIYIPLSIFLMTTVWFTWGGVRDLRRLFTRLKTARRDIDDDGSVSHDLDAAEPGFELAGQEQALQSDTTLIASRATE